MFMLDLATGLRRGEIVGLQWKDINFETGTLSVTKQVRYVKGQLVIDPPKTKASERSIILSPPVLEMLTEWERTHNAQNAALLHKLRRRRNTLAHNVDAEDGQEELTADELKKCIEIICNMAQEN